MSPLITPPLQLPWASPKVPSKCSPMTLQVLLSWPCRCLHTPGTSHPLNFPRSLRPRECEAWKGVPNRDHQLHPSLFVDGKVMERRSGTSPRSPEPGRWLSWGWKPGPWTSQPELGPPHQTAPHLRPSPSSLFQAAGEGAGCPRCPPWCWGQWDASRFPKVTTFTVPSRWLISSRPARCAPRMLSSWDLTPACSRLPGAGMSPASRPAKVTAQAYPALASPDSFFCHTLPS